MNTNEAVEAVARAMRSEGERDDPLEEWELQLAQAALAAARPLIMEEAAGIVRKELAMVAALNAETAHPKWLVGLDDASTMACQAIRTAAKTDGGGA